MNTVGFTGSRCKTMYKFQRTYFMFWEVNYRLCEEVFPNHSCKASHKYTFLPPHWLKAGTFGFALQGAVQ